MKNHRSRMVSPATFVEMPAIALILAILLSLPPYRTAAPGYVYRFPADHFDHPEFRTEWWYYTGNLNARDGRRFGFELVFFRQGERQEPGNPSAWTVQDVYLAHLALTDAQGRRFLFHERLNRRGPGIAGVSAGEQRVWNGNWSAQWHGNQQVLKAVAPEFALDLAAVSATPPVIHGLRGISQKAQGAGHASHYVSLPRLDVSGRITLDGKGLTVAGTAWMDHEWFTEQLAPDQVGWDWFSVQLDDRRELMLFQLRRKDGTIDPYSSGTWIGPDGKPVTLSARDFTLKPVSWWKKYPVEWEISVPSRNLRLRCKAVLLNQELSSYWEGAVDYSGSAKGVGYLEMTGYEKPVSFH